MKLSLFDYQITTKAPFLSKLAVSLKLTLCKSLCSFELYNLTQEEAKKRIQFCLNNEDIQKQMNDKNRYRILEENSNHFCADVVNPENTSVDLQVRVKCQYFHRMSLPQLSFNSKIVSFSYQELCDNNMHYNLVFTQRAALSYDGILLKLVLLDFQRHRILKTGSWIQKILFANLFSSWGKIS